EVFEQRLERRIRSRVCDFHAVASPAGFDRDRILMVVSRTARRIADRRGKVEETRGVDQALQSSGLLFGQRARVDRNRLWQSGKEGEAALAFEFDVRSHRALNIR